MILFVADGAFAAKTDVVVLKNGDHFHGAEGRREERHGDGTLDVGGSYTIAQTSIDLDADYRRPSYDVFTRFLSNVTRESGSDTITQFTLRSGYMHFRGDGWIVSPFAFVARNVDLGLSHGAAVGREDLTDGRTIGDVDASSTSPHRSSGTTIPELPSICRCCCFPNSTAGDVSGRMQTSD